LPVDDCRVRPGQLTRKGQFPGVLQRYGNQSIWIKLQINHVK
jgi:hypothetical protein